MELFVSFYLNNKLQDNVATSLRCGVI